MHFMHYPRKSRHCAGNKLEQLGVDNGKRKNIRNHLATNDVRIFPRDPTESYPKWPKVDPRLGNTTRGPAFH